MVRAANIAARFGHACQINARRRVPHLAHLRVVPLESGVLHSPTSTLPCYHLHHCATVRRVFAQPPRHRSRVQPFWWVATSRIRTRRETDQDIERLMRLPGKHLRIFDYFGQRLSILFVLYLELPPPVQVVRAESAVKQMRGDRSCNSLCALAITSKPKRSSPAKQVIRLHLHRKRLESVIMDAIVVEWTRQPTTKGSKSRTASNLRFPLKELKTGRLAGVQRLWVENLFAYGLAGLQ